MKSVVCVMGSPRSDGNSAAIADVIMNTAKGLGALTTKFVLNDLVFRGCQACMACKTGAEKCIVNDDLAQVLDAVQEADVLVMTSPIYFGQISGQLKCFIDRTYSYLKPDYMTNQKPSRLGPGKKCIFVLTQGSPDEKSYDVYPSYAGFLKWFGYDCHVVRGIGLRAKTDASGQHELMKKAEEVAKEVLSS
jgi:multimeric flavodoxin WrbA